MAHGIEQAVKGEKADPTISEHFAARKLNAVEEQHDPVMGHVPLQANTFVGLDLGKSSFLTTSDGFYIGAVDNRFDDLDHKLARLKRQTARQADGSNNQKRVLEKIRRFEQKKRDIRENILQMASAKIAYAHSVAVVEDLSNAQLAEGARLAGKDKKLREARDYLFLGRCRFVQLLESKLKRSGGALIRIPPQGSLSRCPVCGGIIEEAELADGAFKCPHCGYESSREFNKSVNIARRGLEFLLGRKRAHELCALWGQRLAAAGRFELKALLG